MRLWQARNTGHVNVGSLLSILSLPGVKNTVLSSERRGGAAFYLAGRAAVGAIADAVLGERSDSDSLQPEQSYYVVSISSDAFSSSTARTDDHKHQVTEVVVSATGCPTRRLWADLTSVKHSTGQEFRSVIVRQLESLNVKTWEAHSNLHNAHNRTAIGHILAYTIT